MTELQLKKRYTITKERKKQCLNLPYRAPVKMGMNVGMNVNVGGVPEPNMLNVTISSNNTTNITTTSSTIINNNNNNSNAHNINNNNNNVNISEPPNPTVPPLPNNITPTNNGIDSLFIKCI